MNGQRLHRPAILFSALTHFGDTLMLSSRAEKFYTRGQRAHHAVDAIIAGRHGEECGGGLSAPVGMTAHAPAPAVHGDEIQFLRHYAEYSLIPAVRERVDAISDTVKNRLYCRLFEGVNAQPITATAASILGVGGAAAGWFFHIPVLSMSTTVASLGGVFVGPMRIRQCLEDSAEKYPDEMLHCMGDLHVRLSGGEGDVPGERPERFKPCLDAAPTCVHWAIGWLMVRFRAKQDSLELLEGAVRCATSSSKALATRFREAKDELAAWRSRGDRRIENLAVENGEQDRALDLLMEDVTTLQHANAVRSQENEVVRQLLLRMKEDIEILRMQNAALAGENETLRRMIEGMESRYARLLELVLERNKYLEGCHADFEKVGAEVY